MPRSATDNLDDSRISTADTTVGAVGSEDTIAPRDAVAAGDPGVNVNPQNKPLTGDPNAGRLPNDPDDPYAEIRPDALTIGTEPPRAVSTPEADPDWDDSEELEGGSGGTSGRTVPATAAVNPDHAPTLARPGAYPTGEAPLSRQDR